MATSNEDITECLAGIKANLQGILAVSDQETVRNLVYKATLCVDKLCTIGSAMHADQEAFQADKTALQASINEKEEEIVKLKAIKKQEQANANEVHTLLKDHYNTIMASIPGATTNKTRTENLLQENAVFKENDSKLRAKISKLDTECQEKHTMIKTLRDEVQDYEDNWEAFMTEKNDHLKASEEEIKALKEENKDLREQAAKLLAFIDSLKEIVGKLDL